MTSKTRFDVLVWIASTWDASLKRSRRVRRPVYKEWNGNYEITLCGSQTL